MEFGFLDFCDSYYIHIFSILRLSYPKFDYIVVFDIFQILVLRFTFILSYIHFQDIWKILFIRRMKTIQLLTTLHWKLINSQLYSNELLWYKHHYTNVVLRHTFKLLQISYLYVTYLRYFVNYSLHVYLSLADDVCPRVCHLISLRLGYSHGLTL